MSYSPTLGRFLERDPIGYDDGMNPYQFVGGNPIGQADPSGLDGEKIVKPGVNQLKIPVDNGVGLVGNVEVNTDVVLEYASDDGPKQKGELVSMSYKGTKCENSTWVQFFWEEIFVGRNEVRTRKSGTLKSGIGNVTLTEDPKHPVWYVDGSLKTPAYEEEGLSLPDKKLSNTIFDQPYSNISKIEILQDDIKDETVTNIQVVKHFATYLVSGGKVVAGFQWIESNAWNQKMKDYGFRIDVPKNQKGNLEPSPGELKAIGQQYPKQDIIKVRE